VKFYDLLINYLGYNYVYLMFTYLVVLKFAREDVLQLNTHLNSMVTLP